MLHRGVWIPACAGMTIVNWLPVIPAQAGIQPVFKCNRKPKTKIHFSTVYI